jgi:molybdate transport system substrate-binding protein
MTPPFGAPEATVASHSPVPGRQWRPARLARDLVRRRREGRSDDMNAPQRAPFTIALTIAAALALPTASFAQVKVIISGGFSAAYRELLPVFERTTGITVTTTSGGSVGSGPNTIGGQIRRGVPADVVILAREGLGDLVAEGRIVAGTDVDLAQSTIGLAVRAGAPKPDISTVDAFKQTLLRAKSIAMSSSTSGVYLTTSLFRSSASLTRWRSRARPLESQP